MKVWYNNIWLQYLKQFNLEVEDKSILVLDTSTSHFSEDFLTDIDLKNILFHYYIQGGLTRFLKITNEIIFKGFIYTGIGNSLNREEVSKFKVWNKMKAEKPIIIEDFEKEDSNNVKGDIDVKDEDEYFKYLI